MEKACKDHPYHDQKQGVCPSCLREKLSQIYAVAAVASRAPLAAGVSCSSNSMYCSSVSFSTHMSPLHHRHQRTGSDNMGSISFKSVNGLKKSRSLAFVSRSLVGDVKHGKNKKKKGFWSKLLHLKGKKDVNFDGNNIALKGFA